MYMTVSKITRKDMSPVTVADVDTIMPSMAAYDDFRAYIVDQQAAGKIIYRSSTINVDAAVETVTLYETKADFDTFKALPAFIDFETNLEVVYNTPEITEEAI
jgi:hypothetical protein